LELVPPLATHLFDYVLPRELIAQTPAARRDHSRLLVVDRAAHTVSHHTFADLPQFLRPTDTLFRNNASVLPARLLAVRPTGGQVECFLLRADDHGDTWRCLIKPGKKLPVGATFAHPTGLFRGEIVAKEPDGSAHVRFSTPDNRPITEVANHLGEVPLPPYILRLDSSRRSEDLERYQTVYADRSKQVAVAAPTAGLHFTPELLATLAAKGVETAEVTLHVGMGTFRPIIAETIELHLIHRELYELPVATQQALARPRGRRVAVGTTSVRSIEDYLAQSERPSGAEPYIGEAGLFIYPPYTFRGTDALITNFHQPRSTLLCLVAAFLTPGSTDGVTWIRDIYAEAIALKYRFFSYGDAMLIV